MKLRRAHHASVRLWQRAFTMVEMTIVIGLVAVVGTAMIYCNLYGLSMSARQQIWMRAINDSSQAIQTMAKDVHAAVLLSVGNYVNGSFVPNPEGTNQWGDAVRLFYGSTTNAGPWVDYYYMTNALVRTNYNGVTSGGSTIAGNASVTITESQITNDTRVFTLESFIISNTTGSNAFESWVTNSSVATLSTVDVYLGYIRNQNAEVSFGNTGSNVNTNILYVIRTKIFPRKR